MKRPLSVPVRAGVTGLNIRVDDSEHVSPRGIESGFRVGCRRLESQPSGSLEALRIAEKGVETFSKLLGVDRIANPAGCSVFDQLRQRAAAADDRRQPRKLRLEHDQPESFAHLRPARTTVNRSPIHEKRY